MYAADLNTYLKRVDAWHRAPKSDRSIRETFDERGRPCKELWALGMCYTRIIKRPDGLCELYADRGMRSRSFDQGKVSFNTWDDPASVFGNGKPHGMPSVPGR